MTGISPSRDGEGLNYMMDGRKGRALDAGLQALDDDDAHVSCALPLDTETENWLEAWAERFDAWWAITPYKDAFRGCMGSLGKLSLSPSYPPPLPPSPPYNPPPPTIPPPLPGSHVMQRCD